ncbi:MAG: DUF3568 family protein [Phycisphaeraceae bacterium]|nr:DUF3568 family protein [Phycisphaeraceae bacterium]
MPSTRRVSALVLGSLLVVVGVGLGACSGSTKSGTSYTLTPLRTLEAYLPGSIATVHDASVAALRDDLKYDIQEQKRDALAGEVRARNARGTSIRILTARDSDAVTKVTVHSGGDENLGRIILETVEKRLK